MITTIIHKIKEGNRYLCIDIGGSMEQPIFYVLLVVYEKGELHIVYSKICSGFKDLEALDLKKTAVLISISNELVLSKIVSDTNASKEELLINNAFPNLNINDFYFEISRQNNTALVHICKKNGPLKIEKRI